MFDIRTEPPLLVSLDQLFELLAEVDLGQGWTSSFPNYLMTQHDIYTFDVSIQHISAQMSHTPLAKLDFLVKRQKNTGFSQKCNIILDAILAGETMTAIRDLFDTLNRECIRRSTLARSDSLDSFTGRFSRSSLQSEIPDQIISSGHQENVIKYIHEPLLVIDLM